MNKNTTRRARPMINTETHEVSYEAIPTFRDRLRPITGLPGKFKEYRANRPVKAVLVEEG